MKKSTKVMTPAERSKFLAMLHSCAIGAGAKCPTQAVASIEMAVRIGGYSPERALDCVRKYNPSYFRS